MPEIVSIQVGQCGNQIGCGFWETIAEEHGINQNGKYKGDSNDQYDKLGVYFNEVGKDRFLPRAVMVDLDPATLDTVRGSKLGSIFNPENLIMGSYGTANNWAKGHYTEGAELIDCAMECIRREIEKCDCPQGVQICHSLGGGTGSGMGTLIMIKLRDEFRDRMLSSYSVTPSPKTSEIVVEQYNATLSLHKMTNNCQFTSFFDNGALFDIARRNLKIDRPSNKDLNHLIANAMSGVTASLRFPGQLNADMRKLATNMIPFPRLHFFVPGYAPMVSRGNSVYQSNSVSELAAPLFDAKNMLVSCDPNKGKYLTCGVIFRGKCSMREVDEEMLSMQNKYSSNFAEFIPNNVKTAVCGTPSEEAQLSATFLGNTTAIKEMFQNTYDSFTKMYRRKAFLHWYKGEGMDEEEFNESGNDLQDLISEYQQYEEIGGNDNKDEEDGLGEN